jgi:tol-pal system protein YbgF
MLGKKQKGALGNSERGGPVVFIGYRFKIQNSDFRKYCLPFTVCCILVSACFFLSACATSSDIDLLRQDIDRLQRESFSTRADLGSLTEKTASVASEESLRTVRQSQAEMQATISSLSRDIQVLNGRFDEHKYFIEKSLKNSSMETDLVKLQLAGLEKQIKEVKNGLAILEGHMKEQVQESDPRKEEARTMQSGREDQSAKPSASSDRLSKYDAAYNAFKEKKYKESREKFEQFMKEFPNDKLTPNAYFWIAETYYNERDFEGAILSYESLLKKYPQSEKSPGALLKQGLSFDEIGDRKTAKVILEQLIERFPKSREAEAAKKSLEKLSGAPVRKK